MHCTLILWNLERSAQTVQSLRSYLRDHAVDAYAQVDGLREKIWVSSTGPEGEMWGAIYLWDDEQKAYGRPPGVSRVVELIGYAPTQRTYFSVEAAVTGPGVTAMLGAGIGLAFQDPAAAPLTRPQEFVPAGGAGRLIRSPRYDSAGGEPGEHGDGVDTEH
ncbi:hypothetical protein [Actinoplanes xinjiangensis]|uniref:Uncharacterized protein n=1 Tax=Actinoplanes xinjiangensis TaxID=512350 RepID=A0A316EME7_9ACTN|nr:hypothetical protein [Actinoplanes xinjiangensis]PWK33279.1 hypothetical protein BC793_12869 [Actinoplanes xinjiangensis]GIF43482.1 hypothetical protein Axi01nite_77930 [Actinoplanes xinjiangensis]